MHDSKIDNIEIRPADNGWVIYAHVRPSQEMETDAPMFVQAMVTRVASTDEQLMTELAYLVTNYGR